LDSVGAFVWDLIKEPVAVGEILETYRMNMKMFLILLKGFNDFFG
jgi:hypothetical protein